MLCIFSWHFKYRKKNTLLLEETGQDFYDSENYIS